MSRLVRKKPALHGRELGQERKIVASAKADSHTIQISGVNNSDVGGDSEAVARSVRQAQKSPLSGGL